MDKKIKGLRWRVAGILTLDTINNYMDRMTLSVVIIQIQASLAITDSEFAMLNSLFLLAYAIMYAGGGRLVDLLGTYIGFLLINVFWALAVIAHGFSNGFLGLAISRFLLGIGEGGGFPASSKAVSEWFPARERSIAFGMFNTGSSIGSLIAVPLFSFIMLTLGWRAVFFVAGGLGLLWSLYWAFFYSLPEEHPNITDEELELITNAHREEAAEEPVVQVRWLDLFRDRAVMGLIAVKFLTDPVWYFYIFWIPKYLFDERGFDIAQVGYFAWIPYAAAGFGSMLGGWLSSWFIRKGRSLNLARKLTLGFGAALMPAAIMVVSVPVSLAIVFISLAFMGHQIWNVVIQTLPADLYPKSHVGSVAGLIGSSGAFGGMVFAAFVGWLLASAGSYAPVFAIAGLLHPISFAILLLMIPRIRRVTPAAA
ncbi:MAG: MFS transporter [Acidobacteria bacterium]|jgi:ACS family hexuronate transporter-like MFS transporter|nr:MFS transporter [Acidobacteriota bacterium]MED5559990.1 MFS transporter [Acidobacteriota bacterium]MEE2649393.1 MFS transporter [Acidobacteriota bacterium]|tara:strand:- start:19 stop:1290 length:1272 start_codon:yes stop_codon:yes gene_type:complete